MFWLKQIYYGLQVFCLVALIFNRYRLARENLVFIPIIFSSLLIQFLGDLLKARGLSYYFLFHIYIPVEYVFLGVYYSTILINKVVRFFITFSTVAFFLSYLVYYLLDFDAFMAPSFSQFVVSSVLISICVVIYFIELFQKEENLILLRETSFWVNAGNLLFYAGCLFVMGLYFSLKERDAVLAGKVLSINHALNLLLYSFY